MKIFVQGADLRGRYELADAPLDALAERYRSARRTCFTVDFDQEHRHRADCFLITAEEQLDWMLEDTEILERNLYADPARTELLQRALGVLEHERPLSREAFTGENLTYLRGLSLATLKPGMVIAGTPPDDQLQRYVRDLHQALGRIFFYTAGKSEAHVWEVAAGAAVTSAAGQIHSDLERGFIRAEVFNIATLDQFRTPQEAKTKGFLQIVDRSYRMAAGDVIDVKFNV